MQNRPQPLKLWYFGPCFRHEHPQADRYRQFWQFGFEVLGEENAVIDAQIVQIFYNILRELKLKNLVVEINSIGDVQCRAYYKKVLTSFLKSRESLLCPDCRRRVRENPLRVLDCKEEKCQKIIIIGAVEDAFDISFWTNQGEFRETDDVFGHGKIATLFIAKKQVFRQI